MALPTRSEINHVRNSKCRPKPQDVLTSGCPPMSNRVGQCRYCLKVVGVTGKCRVCRWDFANISRISHSIPEILCTSGLLSAILNSGWSRRRRMSAMAQLSWAWSKIGGSRWNYVSMWLRTGDMGGGNFTPTPLAILRCKITLDKAGLRGPLRLTCFLVFSISAFTYRCVTLIWRIATN